MYTCPMHPEIREAHPGACPKCGMALEPKTISAEEEEDPELIVANAAMSFSPVSVIGNSLRLKGIQL
jgi:Heavy metal binding domain